mmetsp:Transcript_37804/g.87190  ORF Transcript_37804/g.87190 Transcript_37804/m.87190 type:complete len:126 (+) Transcript_37804:3-380(+)
MMCDELSARIDSLESKSGDLGKELRVGDPTGPSSGVAEKLAGMRESTRLVKDAVEKDGVVLQAHMARVGNDVEAFIRRFVTANNQLLYKELRTIFNNDDELREGISTAWLEGPSAEECRLALSVP